MLSNRALALAVGLAVLPQMVYAAEDAAGCVDASARYVEARYGKWIELTSDSGSSFAASMMKPPGLPYGNKAARREIDGRSGGMVLHRRRYLHADGGPGTASRDDG